MTRYETVNIIKTTDNNYAQHLGVMLISLFKNKKLTTNIEIFVIDGGISEQNISKLKLISEKYKFSISFRTNSEQDESKLCLINNQSHIAAYRKIFISSILPNLDKVLYLDCDIIINDDLSLLWNTDISMVYLAATRDYFASNRQKQSVHNYFNTGVMLVNLKKWRIDKISEQIFKNINSEDYDHYFLEQNAINTVISSNYLSLPLKYNQLSYLFTNDRQLIPKEENLEEAVKSPTIIHFAGSKLNSYFCMHPKKREYRKYLQLSPWSDFKPTDKTIKKIAAYILKKLLPNPIFIIVKKVSHIKELIGIEYLAKLLSYFTYQKTNGIIILKIDHLGDLIIFSSSLRYYREIYPGKKLTMVVNEKNIDFVKRITEDGIIDDFITINEIDFKKRKLWYIFKITFHITSKSYQSAIHPTFSRTIVGDLLVKLIRSKDKIGFSGENINYSDIKSKQKNDRTYSSLIVLPTHTSREVDRNRIFTQSIGAEIKDECLPFIKCNQGDYNKADAISRKNKIPPKYCVLFPGAANYYKIWPEDKYAEVANYLVSIGITPVICGTSNELPIAIKISKSCKECIIISGQTDIWTLAALLKKSKFYIGNDTGIMHLAASVQTPIICLMGGGHFGRFFPYGDLNINRVVYNHNIKCMNDNWKCVADERKSAPCIEAIQVKDVIIEISKLLSLIENKNKPFKPTNH